MRLWHYQLLSKLPTKQLSAQWRELNSIFKHQVNHILINYVYDFPKANLKLYADYVIQEMISRGWTIKSWDNYYSYFENIEYDTELCGTNPFPNIHTDNYLRVCFWNLYEKMSRGQDGLTLQLMVDIKLFVEDTLGVKIV